MYSYADHTELAPDIDALTHDLECVDSFARDCEDFDRDACADSPDEYVVSLLLAVDAHRPVTSESSTAHAHVRASRNMVARVEAQRDTRARSRFYRSLCTELTRLTLPHYVG